MNNTEKNTLENDLASFLEEKLKVLSDKDQKVYLKKLALQTKDNILAGFENTVDQTTIPKDKKNELKQKLLNMTSAILKQPFFEHVLDALIRGIEEIIEALLLPLDQKARLSELTKTAEKNIINLKENVMQYETTHGPVPNAEDIIVEEIMKAIDNSSLSAEKKEELKAKLHKIYTDNLNQHSIESGNALREGIADILNYLPLNNQQKSKFLRDLDDSGTGDNIKGLKKTNIEGSPISGTKPEEAERAKKVEGNYLSDLEKSNNIKHNIQDKIGLPIDEENKATQKVNKSVKEPQYNKQKGKLNFEELQNNTHKNILRGLEEYINKASIPMEKKIELKNKLANMLNESFNDPLSEDIQDSLKGGIYDILEELNLPKNELDKMKHGLTDIVDRNITALQNEIKERHSDTDVSSDQSKVEIKNKERTLSQTGQDSHRDKSDRQKKARTSIEEVDSSLERDPEKSSDKCKKGRTSAELDSSSDRDFGKPLNKRRKERTSADDRSLDRD
ncbi:hypothetical protein B5X24_HaOG211824, partial [Helicoverpa armigera]